MRYSYKTKLSPPSSNGEGVEALETRMAEVLENKTKSTGEKLHIYQDLLARLSKLTSEMSTIPRVEVVQPKRNELEPIDNPQYSAKELALLTEIQPKLKQCSNGEAILDGRILEGSDLSAIIQYALKKTSGPPPLFYDEVARYFEKDRILSNLTLRRSFSRR